MRCGSARGRAEALWLLLLPVSLFYSVAVQLRNSLYTLGWVKSARLPRPVISIRNLTVGGTGKTPTCLWLAEELKGHGIERRNFEPRMIVVKKLDRSVLQPQSADVSTLDNHADIAKPGDEPLMMARLLWPDYRHRQEPAGAAAAEGCCGKSDFVDAFILDDGFQHRRVKRDVDSCIDVAPNFPAGLFPAGPAFTRGPGRRKLSAR